MIEVYNYPFICNINHLYNVIDEEENYAKSTIEKYAAQISNSKYAKTITKDQFKTIINHFKQDVLREYCTKFVKSYQLIRLVGDNLDSSYDLLTGFDQIDVYAVNIDRLYNLKYPGNSDQYRRSTYVKTAKNLSRVLFRNLCLNVCLVYVKTAIQYPEYSYINLNNISNIQTALSLLKDNKPSKNLDVEISYYLDKNIECLVRIENAKITYLNESFLNS